MDLPKRKQNRLKDHDYSSPGCYFVTICTHEKHHLLWENVGSVGADIIRPKTSPIRARLAKRVQWTKQRARLGAAVKNFKAYADEIFGNRKRAVLSLDYC